MITVDPTWSRTWEVGEPRGLQHPLLPAIHKQFMRKKFPLLSSFFGVLEEVCAANKSSYLFDPGR